LPSDGFAANIPERCGKFNRTPGKDDNSRIRQQIPAEAMVQGWTLFNALKLHVKIVKEL
jgi:hypothetical protein